MIQLDEVKVPKSNVLPPAQSTQSAQHLLCCCTLSDSSSMSHTPMIFNSFLSLFASYSIFLHPFASFCIHMLRPGVTGMRGPFACLNSARLGALDELDEF